MTAFIASADIATYLGRALTSAEAAQVDAAIDAACASIESYCGRTFGTTAITDQPAKIVGGTIYLSRPILSVSSVKTRSPYVGSSTTTLTASEWSIWDLASGQILVSSFSDGDALVSYTPAATVPEPVIQAACIVTAGLLAPTDDANQQKGIKSYTVGQELTVAYFDQSVDGRLPSTAAMLLAPYKRPVFA